MRRALLALALFLVAGQAWATTYYFSDCAAGGAGTLISPFCLKPTGASVNVSFAWLADGSDPELAAGDTVNLCCGACDGLGACTYYVQNTGSVASGSACHSQTAYFFHPLVSGNALARITIQNYPGEIVTVSGDSGTDRIVNAGDVTTMFMNRDTGSAQNPSYYTIKGNAVGTQKGLRFKRAIHDIFCGSNSAGSDKGGFPGWIFDGVDISEADCATWGVTAGIGTIATMPTGCTSHTSTPICGTGADGSGSAVPGYTMFMAASSGDLAIRNSTFHTSCGTAAIRTITGAPHNSTLLVEDSEFYDVATSVEFWDNSHLTLQRNYVHDMINGVQIEDRASDVTIQDNRFACEGTYAPLSTGACGVAIIVNDGDNNDITDTFNGKYNQTHDVTIRRNRIWQIGTGPLSNSGKLGGGIYWAADCLDAKGCTNINGLIENNFIWDVNLFSGHVMSRGAIDVQSNKAITVQHNTVSGARYGMQLEGECGSARTNGACPGCSEVACVTDVVHDVKDNIFDSCAGECIAVYPDASRTGIVNNNAKPSGSEHSIADCPAVTGNGTDSAEVCVPAINLPNFSTCLSFPTDLPSNRCAASTFLNTTNPPATRNYHLRSTDTGNINFGSGGAALDYDGETRADARAGAPDIGADEYIQYLADPGFEVAGGAFDPARWQHDSSCSSGASEFFGSGARTGSKSMSITQCPTSPDPCIGESPCEGITQTISGLTAGASYSLSGYYFPADQGSLDICPNTDCTRDADCLAYAGLSTCAVALHKCLCAASSCPAPQVCTAFGNVFSNQALGRTIRFVADMVSPTPDVELCGGATVGTANTWTSFGCTFTAPASSFTFRLWSSSSGGPHYLFRVDDLSLVHDTTFTP